MVFNLILICINLLLIGQAIGHCAKCCNTPNYHDIHGPLKVFYEGEKCDCDRTIPVHIERLKEQPTRQLKHHNYDIETVSVPKEPECGSFNFHKEILKVDPEKKRQTFEYDLYTPPEPKADPKPSVHSYLVEKLKPIVYKSPNHHYGHIDRILVQNRDCEKHIVEEEVSTGKCGPCGNCPCSCGTKKSSKGLEKLFGNAYSDSSDSDMVVFDRYDKKLYENDAQSRKKRFIPMNNKDDAHDDDTLLQMSFFKMKPLVKPNKIDNCGKYEYMSCGHRGPQCSECYNCTCLPVSQKINDIDSNNEHVELNFVIPENYDPIMRQEVFEEPLQYTDQSYGEYERLTKILQQHSKMSTKNSGDLLNPPPAKQTQEMISLLIDLIENKQDVKAYQQSNSFHNPHDWMYIVDTDNLAHKVHKHEFHDVLPIKQLEHGKTEKIKFIDDRKPTDIQLPSREPPKILYEKLDTIADMYKNFNRKSPISIQQLLLPVNQFLEFQANMQVQQELDKNKFLNAFRSKRSSSTIKNEKYSINPKTSSKTAQILEIDEQDNFDDKLFELYETYQKLLKKVNNNKHKTKQRSTNMLEKKRYEKTRKTTFPKFVVLKEDAGVLLGDEPKTHNDNNSEEYLDEDIISGKNNEFIS